MREGIGTRRWSIRSALSSSGFGAPRTRTTINLAPADVRTEGPSFDLPIAVGMMLADDQIRVVGQFE